MDRDVVIVSAVRTPFGKFGGPMKDIPIENLGALAMNETMRRVNLPAVSRQNRNVLFLAK